MNRRSARLTRVFVLLSVLSATACQPRDHDLTVEERFRGKTIRLVVAFAAGGGYDVQARLLADHFGRHIPGAPAIVVDNMPGAGGLIAASYIDRQVPDGLTLGMVGAAPVITQLIAQSPVAFDVSKWTVIGSTTAENDDVCVVTKESSLSLDRWRSANRGLRIADTGPGSTSHFRAALLASALGLPVRFVSGYRGTADMRLALEGGEIDVLCVGLNSYRSTMEPVGRYVPILQSGADARIAEQQVPSATALAGDTQGRAFLDLLSTLHAIDRYFVAPPGIPGDVAESLRRAMADALTDESYLTAAQAARITSKYVDAETISTRLASLVALPADVRKAATTLLTSDELNLRAPDVAR